MYSGDYDVIFDGVHENILQLQYHDPVMLKTVSLSYIQLPIAILYDYAVHSLDIG